MSTSPLNIDVPKFTNFEHQHVAKIAQNLGKILSNTPEHQAFLKALNDLKNDADMWRLSESFREHNIALQRDKGNPAEHQSALEQLNQEMKNLPCVAAYRQEEMAIIRLFKQIDRVISQAAGIEFASNAKQSGCGCGG